MNAIAAAARTLVGSRFRLHGRDPASGLDCIGVVACASGAPAPTGYALRGGDEGTVARALEATGFQRVSAGAAGDVMVMRVGPGQLHLAVRTAGGFVHADASLRRVVERPGEPEWEVVGQWRL